ncbi:sphingosine kinase [Niveomyces insectorum RCEF 264]|uniref:Sphingosine kinase n=1 Tax=Niveomyces insectorum RCEF 264 TaxID=1081102 RepID=A0A167XYF8_9HYPO|nr:sphingosine kinase [Niveomyces insectorum RCEF 264]
MSSSGPPPADLDIARPATAQTAESRPAETQPAEAEPADSRPADALPSAPSSVTTSSIDPSAPLMPPSTSASDSLASPTAKAPQRQSHVVSFDKSVENVFKLQTHDLNIEHDTLVVIDKEKRKKSRRTCDLGLHCMSYFRACFSATLQPRLTSTSTSSSSSSSPQTAGSFRRSIPLYNVLWADVSADNRSLVIDFAETASKSRLRVARLAVSLEPAGPDRPTPTEAAAWAELLRSHAYGSVPQKRRAYVLVNPHAGPGGAMKKWESQVRPFFEAARMQLTVVTTTYAGQAVDLCADLDITRYDMVVACSGDGLPHEVFNGLGKRPDARRALAHVAVAHIPCGSGNAMACNLYGTHRASLAALAIVKGVVAPLDLVSITHGDRRTLSFLSQAVGIVAEVDLGTENLRWMGGARFTWGFLQRLLARRVYPCDLAVKAEIVHKDGVKAHYSRQQQQHQQHRDHHQQQQQDRRDEAQRLYERAKLGSSAASDEDSGAPADASTAESATESTAARDDAAQGNGSAGASASDEGLPPLQFGTVNDELPEGWELVPQDKLGNFYCGNVRSRLNGEKQMAYMAADANFFSAALMNDGLLDLITIDGDISPAKSLAMMLSVEDGHFFDNPLVRYQKIVGFRLIPKQQNDGYISIDGERIPFAPFQAEVHQGLGRVIAKRANGYEAPGPANWDKVSVTERLMA